MQPSEPLAHSSPQTNGFNGNTNGHPDDTELDERGRPRNKKRDFFGTLKRKLGRSKSRAKSADRGMIPIDAQNPRLETRSISADRSMYANSNGLPGAGAPPTANQTHPQAQQQRLIVPTLDQSRRSSLSESSAISGLSSASAKTFVHEASTLVLETVENGVKR